MGKSTGFLRKLVPFLGMRPGGLGALGGSYPAESWVRRPFKAI